MPVMTSIVTGALFSVLSPVIAGSQAPAAVFTQTVSGDAHAPLPDNACSRCMDIIRKLAQGNKDYMTSRQLYGSNYRPMQESASTLMADPLHPVALKAVVITDSLVFDSAWNIFGADHGELQVVRIAGFVCSPSLPDDGVVGSVEFALSQDGPPVLMVLGNSQNMVMQAAMRIAMMEAGRTDVPEELPILEGYKHEDMDTVQALMPSARDALVQLHHADFEQLCDLAVKLHVWNTIEALLMNSNEVVERVQQGILQIHGTHFEVKTGKVTFMGEHPSQAELLATRTAIAQDNARTAAALPVPAEEAQAQLFAGNRRYYTGRGVSKKNVEDFKSLRSQLSESGQNPMAVVLGCADSRAPVEILFDVKPGDLFVLRNAGNTCPSGGSVIGSAEYAVLNLRTKLLVVAGHTKCGAVTLAVEAVHSNKSLTNLPGSLGAVLTDLHSTAAEVVGKFPDASLKDQVAEATKGNVFGTMEKFIRHSDIIRDAVMAGDVQIHGAIYDIGSGSIEWLGQHPNLERVVGRSLPLYQWKVKPYIRSRVTEFSASSAQLIDKLREGNKRFIKGIREDKLASDADQPFAVIVAGAEVRVGIERIFDSGRNDLIVQRVMGNIAGHRNGTLMRSLEYSVVTFAPKLLLVVGESESEIVSKALRYVSGEEPASQALRTVVDPITVSALRAIKEVNAASTTAGRAMQMQQLAVELNVFYTVEQLLLRSEIIRDAMNNHGLEVQGAILNQATGDVEFLGPHPMTDFMLNEPIEEVTSEETPKISEKEDHFGLGEDHQHHHEHDEHERDHGDHDLEHNICGGLDENSSCEHRIHGVHRADHGQDHHSVK